MLLPRIKVMILCALLAVSLAACNKNGTPDSSPAPADESVLEPMDSPLLPESEPTEPPEDPEDTGSSHSPVEEEPSVKSNFSDSLESQADANSSKEFPDTAPPAAEEPLQQSDATNETPSAATGARSEMPATRSAFRSEGEAPVLDSAEIEQQLFSLINQEREAQGVNPLAMEDSMWWAARIRAPEALSSLSHTRPDGTPYYSAFDEADFAYAGKWHGENVSSMHLSKGLYDSDQIAKEIFETLCSSEGHYQNMLSPNFEQMGIGIHIEEDVDTLSIGCAQLFSSR